MAKYQPICPIRNDAKCMGAMCALSRYVTDDGSELLFTCSLASLDGGRGLAVIDRREPAKDPVERT